MSLKIIRSGILDSVQDRGRYGLQQTGINPNGAMDPYSAQLANALLGKDLHAPVIEFHFPAGQIQFQEPSIICITGADFTPVINGKVVPLNHPIVVQEQSVLQFTKRKSGMRSYVSFYPELDLETWMNSYSTNIVCGAGGYSGRGLQKGDHIKTKFLLKKRLFSNVTDFSILHWTGGKSLQISQYIRFIFGSEWQWLTSDSKSDFKEKIFQITNEADRMGYRLASSELELNTEEQLVSSGVTFGTVQLLPKGQLIILMADHQTTGGYPRIANIISVDLPVLAQKGPNDVIRFQQTDLAAAEHLYIQQQKEMKQIQAGSKFKMESLLHENM